MATSYSPKIVTDGLIFYVDGRNKKSVTETGNITSIITQESKPTTATVERSTFIQSNFGYIDKFTNISLADKPSFTLSVVVDDTNIKSGTAFSISSISSSVYRASGITLVSSSQISTSVDKFMSYSVSLLSSSEAMYSSSINNTISNDTTNYETTQTTSSIITISSSVVMTNVTKITGSTVNLNTSSITEYSSSQVAILGDGIYNAVYKPVNELSLYIKSTGVYGVHNHGDIQTTVLAERDKIGSTVYSVVYKTGNENVIPISLYKNGILAAQSTEKLMYAQFENDGVSLFNNGDADYAQYGIRLIAIHDKELNSNELLTIGTFRGV